MSRVRLFPGMVFGLLGLNMTVVGITVYLAHADRSFAVEPDYYQKALRWDRDARERERSGELGWTARIDPGAVGAAGRHLSLTLEDQEGRPVTGASVRVIAFASIRAGQRVECDLTPREPGVYAADMPIDRPGLWQFQVRATRAADTFTRTVVVDVPGSERSGGRP